MDTSRAIKIDLSGANPRDAVQPYVVSSIPALLTTDSPSFGDLICWYNCPQGVASIYVGDKFDVKGTEIAFPYQIDWRLFHGVGCPGQGGTYDQEPAQGTTTIKSRADLSKEGLLFQFGGLQADQYFLQARVRVPSATSTVLKATIFARFNPGLQQAAPAITVGTVIG